MINKKINKIFHRLIKEEHGQVLPLVLILLVLGSTILAGTLAYGSASLKTGRINQDRAEELYAADAGVRYAIWKLNNEFDVGDLLGSMSTGETVSYPITENSKNVNIDIYCFRNQNYSNIYKITSTASGTDSSTSIETYATKIFGLWENAATGGSVVDIWWGGGTLVDGPVIYPYDTSQWPFAAPNLRILYSGQAGPVNPVQVADDEWDVDTDGNIIGPLYYDKPSDTLDIVSSVAGLSLVLGNGTPSAGGNNGTIYVNGDLTIGKMGSKAFTLNMNRNTIYVTGDLLIDASCQLLGSGCIIAEGQIEFKPNLSLASPDDFIFLMSLSSTSYSIQFEPGGSFYGSMAGLINIDLHPGNEIILTEPPPEGLNFPIDDGNFPSVWALRTWQINRTTGGPSTVLTITSGPFLQKGEEGIAYPFTPQTLAATGGTPPYSNWTVIGNSLPPGSPAFVLNATTGEITGTPTAAGTYNFKVEVKDSNGDTATKDMIIFILPAPEIDPNSLDEAEVGVTYSDAVTISPGIPPYVFDPPTGSFPGWATFDVNTGSISGMPGVSGTYNFSVRVEDSYGGEDIQPFINFQVYPQLDISTTSPLPDGKKNKAYGATGGVPITPVILQSTGGKPGTYQWSWSVAVGSLPPNLSLDPLTGQIYGTPKNADVGTYSIEFRVTDSLGGSATKVLTLTINS